MDLLIGGMTGDEGMIADLQIDPLHAEMQDLLQGPGDLGPMGRTLEMTIIDLIRLEIPHVNDQEEMSLMMTHFIDNVEIIHRPPQDVMMTMAIYFPLVLKLVPSQEEAILSQISPRGLLLAGLRPSGLIFKEGPSKPRKKL